MNVREGSHRMQRLGRAALIFAAVLFALGVLAITLFRSLPQDPALQFVPMLLLLAIYPAFFGGLLWMAGWIVEGFATPSRNGPSSTPPASEPAPLHEPDRI